MTNTAFRVDRGKLNQARVDHNGNLLCTGVLTRTGVFTYRHNDGTTTRELRHPDDVFDPAAVASFVQVPVTDEHPSEGRVTPDNVKSYSVGNLGDTITMDGRLVKADMVIRDAKTIAKVQGEKGKPKRELSCGYSAEVIKEAGEYGGERYDHRQTNIRGNHVAIVRAGRAGSEVKLLLDAADAEMADSEEIDHSDMMGEGYGSNHTLSHTSTGKPISSESHHQEKELSRNGGTMGLSDGEKVEHSEAHKKQRDQLTKEATNLGKKHGFHSKSVINLLASANQHDEAHQFWGGEKMKTDIEDEPMKIVKYIRNDQGKKEDPLSSMISKLSKEHPEWEQDQVVAVAHRKMGIDKPKK